MLKQLRAAAIAVVLFFYAFFATACASNGTAGTALLNNLQGCSRTYQGSIGGALPGSNRLSVTIQCEPGVTLSPAGKALVGSPPDDAKTTAGQ